MEEKRAQYSEDEILTLEFEYVPTDEDFELVDIPEEDFDRVAAEFDRLMDEPL